MNSLLRFVFVVFSVTAILLITVHVRNGHRQQFYRMCRIRVEQAAMKQQLWEKQLRLESMMNPSKLLSHMEEGERQ